MKNYRASTNLLRNLAAWNKTKHGLLNPKPKKKLEHVHSAYHVAGCFWADLKSKARGSTIFF